MRSKIKAIVRLNYLALMMVVSGIDNIVFDNRKIIDFQYATASMDGTVEETEKQVGFKA